MLLSGMTTSSGRAEVNGVLLKAEVIQNVISIVFPGAGECDKLHGLL